MDFCFLSNRWAFFSPTSSLVFISTLSPQTGSRYDLVALFRRFGLFDKVQCDREPNESAALLQFRPTIQPSPPGRSCVKTTLVWSSPFSPHVKVSVCEMLSSVSVLRQCGCASQCHKWIRLHQKGYLVCKANFAFCRCWQREVWPVHGLLQLHCKHQRLPVVFRPVCVSWEQLHICFGEKTDHRCAQMLVWWLTLLLFTSRVDALQKFGHSKKCNG